MVVGEGGAYGHIDIEPSGWGVEDEFGSCKGVILVEFDDAVVVASGIGSFEVMEAEVEIEQSLACDNGVGDGLFVESGFFFHQPLHGEFFSLHLLDCVRIIISYSNLHN